MRKAAAILPVVLAGLLQHSLHAQPLVHAGGDGTMHLIGAQVDVLEDPSGSLVLSDVLKSGEFKPSEAEVPNMGLSNSAWWVRTRLFNAGNEHRLFLYIPHPEIEEMDVYLIDDNKDPDIITAGQKRPLSVWAVKDLDHVVYVPMAPGTDRSIYLRLKSEKQLQLPIYAGSTGALSAKRSTRDGIGGAYLGIIVVMLLYNLFIFLSTRDRSYLIYVVYIGLVGLTQLNFMGICKVYLWPENGWISIKASLILTVLTALTANLFMRHFINVRHYTPRLAKFGWVFYLLFAIGLVVNFTVSPLRGYDILQFTAAVMAIYQLSVGIVATKRGSRPARFFLLAWSIFLLGIILFVMKDKGVLPYNELTKHTMTWGSAIEVILLSFGLADRINILRREKERSQAEALRASLENERIIREQNVILEHKVDERTHELRESNEHLKRTQSQLVNAEKMASLGQLTAGIAHEINNPVNFITSNIPPLRRNLGEMLEVLQEYRSSGIEDPKMKAIAEREKQLGIDDSISELSDILGSIEEGAGRTAEIVRGLRNFSRLDEGDLKPADINEGLRNTLTVLGPQLRDQLEIDMDLGALPELECYPGKLNQVFMNMLTNAAQAVKARHPNGGGRVSVTTRVVNDQVVVIIHDNGVGMTPETRSRMFEPFFTTKNVGEGTGLGLSIAYGIVEKHHGRIEADSVPGEGSEFRVVLPLQQPKPMEKRA